MRTQRSEDIESMCASKADSCNCLLQRPVAADRILFVYVKSNSTAQGDDAPGQKCEENVILIRILST